MKKVILSVIVLVAVLSIADAAPFQTMGMLRTPDAYVLPSKAAEIQFVYYMRKGKANDWELEHVPYGMLSVGILDRIELGVFAGDKVAFGNVKLKLIKETLKVPQLSIGLENIFSRVPNHYFDNNSINNNPDKRDYESYSPYAVISKQVVIGGVHTMLNFGGGMHRFVGQVPRSRMFSGMFTSVEISPLRDFYMQAEYDGQDFNVGAKYTYHNFSFKLGYQAVENLAKKSEGNGYEKDLRVAAGVSYLFDRYAKDKRRPDLYEFAKDDDLKPIDDGTGLDSGDLATNVDGTTGSGTAVVGTKPKELSPEMNDLLAELRRLRAEREKAQSALDDLRKWIESTKEQP